LSYRGSASKNSSATRTRLPLSRELKPTNPPAQVKLVLRRTRHGKRTPAATPAGLQTAQIRRPAQPNEMPKHMPDRTARRAYTTRPSSRRTNCLNTYRTGSTIRSGHRRPTLRAEGTAVTSLNFSLPADRRTRQWFTSSKRTERAAGANPYCRGRAKPCWAPARPPMRPIAPCKAARALCKLA